MSLKTTHLIFVIGLILLIGIGVCQFSGFEDAPTRRGSVQIRSGTLEGLILEKKTGLTPDAKEVSVTIILSKLPSAFFDYYDHDKKAIVLDLYDTRVGESQLDTIAEYPITGSKVENTQIDLNKEVAGLKPDFRDVVRVMFYSKYGLYYDIEEEFGVLNLKFKSPVISPTS